MSDNTKKGGIPEWQKASSTTSDKNDSPTTVSSSPPPIPPKQVTTADAVSSGPETSENTSVEHASKFLTDETLAQASLDEKIDFLLSKGVSREAIDMALAGLPSAQSSTSTATTPASTESPNLPAQARPSQPASSTGDMAPIITYPEFMLHSTKPPPIITAKRLVNTAYAALGTGALIYGASKYLVQPMVASLTVARHDLATHAQTQLEELNTKLREVVSKEPLVGPGNGITDDSESVDSDPTELFHRDYGTQTMPESDTSSDATEEEEDAITAQVRRLKQLRQLCNDVAIDEHSERESVEGVSNVIKVLNDQLDGMTYARQTYTSGAYGIVTANANKKENDEIAKMRTEIRSMKGVLLSARNFPASQPKMPSLTGYGTA